jgi:hypothetical protein
MSLSFCPRRVGQRSSQPRAGDVIRFEEFMAEPAPGQKYPHQQMIGSDRNFPLGSLSTRQSHRQAHGALGLGASAQSARDRTFGRRGFFIDRLANSRAVDGKSAQGAGGDAIGVGHQAQQQMLLAEIGVPIAAGFGVRLFERHARGGREVVDGLDGAFSRRSGFAAGAGLVFGLLSEPFHQAGLRNEPLSPQVDRRYQAVLQELIDGVLVQPEAFADPDRVAVIENFAGISH